MKPLFTFLFFISSITLFGQDDALLRLIATGKDDIRDCRAIVPEIMSKVSEKFNSNKTADADSLIDLLIVYCGRTESVQRALVFNAILNRKTSSQEIQTYFKNDFQEVFEHRRIDSESPRFESLYKENIEYYGYLPLRHPVDLAITNKAKELLLQGNLSNDEKLMCILFSEGNKAFNKEIAKPGYDNTELKNVRREKRRAEARNYPSVIVSAGMYGTLGSKNRVFGYNPIVRGFISTALKHKVIVDAGFGIKFNANDRDFLFLANNRINTVNSKTTIFLDIYTGYKLYDSKKVIFIPKLGIGYESMGTGQWEWITNEYDEEVQKYHNLETINLSAGFSAMTPVFTKNYIGLSLNYHYSPYHLNKKLHTKINNNALNCEVFFRF